MRPGWQEAFELSAFAVEERHFGGSGVVLDFEDGHGAAFAEGFSSTSATTPAKLTMVPWGVGGVDFVLLSAGEGHAVVHLEASRGRGMGRDTCPARAPC